MSTFTDYKTNVGILREDYDENALNPREYDEGIFTKFYTFLRRSTSPDKNPYRNFKEWLWDFLSSKQAKHIDSLFSNDSSEAVPALVESAFKRGYILLPVWKYEHSGVVYAASMSNPFCDDFDSCLAGVIYCSKQDVYNIYHKKCSKSMVERLNKIMEGEVKVYSAYADGDVYCYCLLEEDGTEGEWCGGFYGSIEENGIKDELGITEYEAL